LPVRGYGWYKRPYKLRIRFNDGRVSTRAFHWSGPWRENVESYMRMIPSQVAKIEVWIETDDQGRPETTRSRDG